MRCTEPESRKRCCSQSSRASAMRTPDASALRSMASTIERLPVSQPRSSASTRRCPSATLRAGCARSIVNRSSPRAVPEASGGRVRSIAARLRPCSVPENAPSICFAATVALTVMSLAASLRLTRFSSSNPGRAARASVSAGPPSKSRRASTSSGPFGAHAMRCAAKRSGVRGSRRDGTSARSRAQRSSFSPARPSASDSSSAEPFREKLPGDRSACIQHPGGYAGEAHAARALPASIRRLR